ncbi:hypothetical protein CsSME_00019807 [Camellia sinensis var. sinensis]
MGRAPCATFKGSVSFYLYSSVYSHLLKEYNVELKGPFNYSARDEAGIPREWYDPSSTNNLPKQDQLSEVYERLACIISMEKENSSLNATE